MGRSMGGPSRWLLAAVVFLSLTPSLRAKDRELSPRYGLPHFSALTKCHVLKRATADFDGSGKPYLAEWYRCGVKNPRPKDEQFPRHYIVVRPPNDEPKTVAITFTNSGGSDQFFLDVMRAVNLQGLKQALFVSAGSYDDSQGSSWCLLGLVDGELGCWPTPDIDQVARQHLEEREETHEKEWVLEPRDGSVHLECPVYLDGRSLGRLIFDLIPRGSRLVASGIRRTVQGEVAKASSASGTGIQP